MLKVFLAVGWVFCRLRAAQKVSIALKEGGRYVGKTQPKIQGARYSASMRFWGVFHEMRAEKRLFLWCLSGSGVARFKPARAGFLLTAAGGGVVAEYVAVFLNWAKIYNRKYKVPGTLHVYVFRPFLRN